MPNSVPAPAGVARPRIPSIQFLRALAAGLVFWNHLLVCNANFRFASPGLATLPRAPALVQGRCVLLFFVLTGAVHLMLLSGRWRETRPPGTLLWLIVRLVLPTAVATLLAGALAFLSAAATGGGWTPDAPQFVSNLLLVAPLCGDDWINPVTWSMAVQPQYLLRFSFGVVPVFAHRWRSLALWLGLLAASVAVGLAGGEARRDVLHYIPFFFLGYLYFEISQRSDCWPWWLCALGLLVVLGRFGAVAGVVALLPFVLLMLPDAPPYHWSVVRWFARISFAVYLLQAPIGGRIVNLGARRRWRIGRWPSFVSPRSLAYWRRPISSTAGSSNRSRSGAGSSRIRDPRRLARNGAPDATGVSRGLPRAGRRVSAESPPLSHAGTRFAPRPGKNLPHPLRRPRRRGAQRRLQGRGPAHRADGRAGIRLRGHPAEIPRAGNRDAAPPPRGREGSAGGT